MAAGTPRLSIVAPRPRSPEEKARGLAAKADARNSPTPSPSKASCQSDLPFAANEHSIAFYRSVQEAKLGGFEALRAAYEERSDANNIPPGSSLHATNVNIGDMLDCSLAAYRPQYQFTVTGRMRKKADVDRPQLGVQVQVNQKDVTLFRYKDVSSSASRYLTAVRNPWAPQPQHQGPLRAQNLQSFVKSPRFLQKVFAMDAKCPHAGGRLALGDIEDMDGHVCVACPVHGFMFALDAGGVSVVPEGTFTLQLYPTQQDELGGISVALPNTIDKSAFTDDDF